MQEYRTVVQSLKQQYHYHIGNSVRHIHLVLFPFMAMHVVVYLPTHNPAAYSIGKPIMKADYQSLIPAATRRLRETNVLMTVSAQNLERQKHPTSGS